MLNHERHDLANGSVVWLTTITDGHYLAYHVWMQVGARWTTIYYGRSQRAATAAVDKLIV